MFNKRHFFNIRWRSTLHREEWDEQRPILVRTKSDHIPPHIPSSLSVEEIDGSSHGAAPARHCHCSNWIQLTLSNVNYHLLFFFDSLFVMMYFQQDVYSIGTDKRKEMNGRPCVSKCTCRKVEPRQICRRRLVLYSVGSGVSALCFISACRVVAGEFGGRCDKVIDWLWRIFWFSCVAYWQGK